MKDMKLRTLLALAIGLTTSLSRESVVRADDFPLTKMALFTWTVDYEGSWSPDGKQIVLVSSRHGGMKVHTMDADTKTHGNEMRQLTTGDAEDDSPAWSPNGKMITFVSVRDGVSQIVVMDADGSDQRQLTQGKAENIHPTWSPDSQRILFNTTHFVGATAADGRDVQATTKLSGSKSIRKWIWPRFGRMDRISNELPPVVATPTLHSRRMALSFCTAALRARFRKPPP